MYIQRLKIEHLRSFESVELALNVPGAPDLAFPNVNVMLGDNGLGKTSVLRAAALSTLGPVLSSSSGYVPESLVRRPPGMQRASQATLAKLPSAVIAADVVLDPSELPSYVERPRALEHLRLTTTVAQLGTAERLAWTCDPVAEVGAVEHLQFDESSTAFFMVGYGATRRVESSVRVDESARVKSRLRRYERISSLFEEHLGLIPLSYWLPAFAKQNRGRYKQVVDLINDLLPADCRMESEPRNTDAGEEHLFLMRGVALPFRALSDGFRAYLGWIGDMIFHVTRGVGSGLKLRDLKGVVLLDEIDLHLHPEWQRVVVPTLARALPQVQFILTTHSPLVVGSLEAGNLFVLAEEDRSTVVKVLPERVHGRNAEQILLSPYFGLDSTRSADVSDRLNVLMSDAVNGDAMASMRYLELLSKGLPRADVTGGVAKRKAPAKRKPAAAGRGKAASSSR